MINRLNREGAKIAKGFCSNRVQQPIERWLVLRFEQRAYSLQATKSLFIFIRLVNLLLMSCPIDETSRSFLPLTSGFRFLLTVP
jgi:hypothetical protein